MFFFFFLNKGNCSSFDQRFFSFSGMGKHAYIMTYLLAVLPWEPFTFCNMSLYTECHRFICKSIVKVIGYDLLKHFEKKSHDSQACLLPPGLWKLYGREWGLENLVAQILCCLQRLLIVMRVIVRKVKLGSIAFTLFLIFWYLQKMVRSPKTLCSSLE